MGVDWNGNKEAERYQGNRSDTMMLVSLDPDHDKVGIISIPRDSQVTIGRHTGKINQAHANGGPELAVSTVRDNFGVEVDHYVVVDTVGLKDLFKLLGPVEVCVEKKCITRQNLGIENRSKTRQTDARRRTSRRLCSLPQRRICRYPEEWNDNNGFCASR